MLFARGAETIGGYRAGPTSGAPRPGLVLIPDVRGLYDHFVDVAERFAAEGFVTLALDLYAREGPPELPDMESVFAWMQALPDARVLGDVGAAVEYLQHDPAVRPGRVGITGFCMGGQYALMAACSVPGLAACVSWYGMVRYARVSRHKPRSPLDMVGDLTCPYLGLFGREDALIPRADVAELSTALTAHGKTFEIHEYAGAGHAFFNDSRPEMYRPQAAADAWPRALAFLRRHLG